MAKQAAILLSVAQIGRLPADWIKIWFDPRDKQCHRARVCVYVCVY